jgi:hypothetical protein
MPQRRITELATALAGELRTGSRTLAEVRALLEPHATGNITPALLWRRVQGHAAIVHAPPSGTWGYHGDGVYDAAEAAIGGGRPSADEACARLIRAYLRAFGPATREDLAQWAGLQRLGPVRPALDRLRLRRFLDEQGRTLYDLPGAPLPDPGAPAPPRLVPRYDNLVLAHADRARVLGDVPVSRIVTKNALVHATILVDGFVAGIWELERGRVRLKPFRSLPRPARADLAAEIERVEALLA